jgi:hypothetical protein
MFLTNYAVNKAAARAASAASSSASAAVRAPPEDEDSVSDKSNADSSDDDAANAASPTAAPPPASAATAPQHPAPCRSVSAAGSNARPSTAGTRKRPPQSKRYEPPMPPWSAQVGVSVRNKSIGLKFVLTRLYVPPSRSSPARLTLAILGKA